MIVAVLEDLIVVEEVTMAHPEHMEISAVGVADSEVPAEVVVVAAAVVVVVALAEDL
jgi:hypothetical protein